MVKPRADVPDSRNLIVLWLDDSKTAQDVPDDTGTQSVTSGSPPPAFIAA